MTGADTQKSINQSLAKTDGKLKSGQFVDIRTGTIYKGMV